jgi:hypothetical protein
VVIHAGDICWVCLEFGISSDRLGRAKGDAT